MSDEDLVPLSAEKNASGGFDIVLRGYDRRQVEDYVERVEQVLGDADRLHHEDGLRLQALEDDLATLKLTLGDAERRAAGLPEPLSQVGDRIASLLRLAEEEADELVTNARERADKQNAERTAELSRREAAISTAGEAADRTRMEAQRDAQALRDKAQQEAEELMRRAQQQAQEVLDSAHEEADRRKNTAEEDVLILSDEARAQTAEMVAQAERDVAELAHQRDVIAGQLEDLRKTLSDAVKPLGTGEHT